MKRAEEDGSDRGVLAEERKVKSDGINARREESLARGAVKREGVSRHHSDLRKPA